MPQIEDVYTITDDSVLTAAPGAGSRKASRIAYRQPPSGGARAVKASSMSLFFWGAGQIYNRQGRLGLLMLLTQALAASIGWSLTRIWPQVRDLVQLLGFSEWQLVATLAGAALLLIPVMLWGVLQAYRYAEAESGAWEGVSNPMLAGFASLILPGWGQLLNAQPGKAVAFLFWPLAGLYSVGLMLLTPFRSILAAAHAGTALTDQIALGAFALGTVAALMWILSVYDAALVASFRRRMV